MTGVKNGEFQAIMNQVQAQIKKVASRDEVVFLEAFAPRFFSMCATDDLRGRSIDELVAILRKQWQFIQDRSPSQAKIRIFNPETSVDGWHSTHSVIMLSHDDVPFVVDSVRMVLNEFGYQIHFIVHFGGLKVMRDAKHNITKVLPAGVIEPDAVTEAPIYIEIDRIPDETAKKALEAQLLAVLEDVKLTVCDWRKMVTRAEESLSELQSNHTALDQEDVAESRDFLQWLINNNFTFLGARDYKLIGDGTNRALQMIPGTGLGVLRDESNSTISKTYAEMPPQARKMALSKNILIIAKTNTISTVHRHTYTDYIGVKRFNAKGELIGERRFIGLYTSTAYNSSPRHIPFLRHKVNQVLTDLGFPPDSHDGKEAVHILETLPRDDLFQASHEELLDLTLGIIQLKERKQIRLFVRRDAFYRYFTCLVYVPREIFTTDLALNMQSILMEALHGTACTFNTHFSDSVLARIHYQIRVDPKAAVDYDVAKVEQDLVAIARSWSDELKDALSEKFDESRALKCFSKYHKAFPASYTECYLPKAAIKDIEKIESLSNENSLAMLFTQSQQQNTLSLKLFHYDGNIVLSDVLPILEQMGLRVIGERPHEIKFRDGSKVWINDFDMIYTSPKLVDIEGIKDVFFDAFKKIWFGQVENDGFNRLVLEANLTWQETTLLRAYTKYFRQIGFTFSQNYIEHALIANAEITRALVQLFALRFDPHCSHKNVDMSDLITYIEQLLDAVKSLDEDRILRRLLEVIQATLRTNYYQHDDAGQPKSYLSFKFDPNLISDLPLPKPKFEIFVYSPRMEGVHLRAGKVARGGLRWSDRREDFRTEVLGLMKAQKVKNTVIVPEGAKGGFVLKRPNLSELSREDYQKEGVACYTLFISGLLDITDNIVDGHIVPPKNVVRYDEDDPYLVVAADKGTATFSDIANGIAQQYGFWLDDAFASGGSVGYDHKKMGITSRGVWVCAKRHFKELDINPDTDDFTVVGIGDMAGDVFGNGLLMSKHAKLLAAFNHLHIFLDPNPDAAKSYEERKRLFNLPRSAWSDYNPELISAGGGVHLRTAKSIKLTPEVKEALSIKEDVLTPNELIRAILKAPVDLIWNGGIGTFVKATTETHADAGDRTNDAIRLDGVDLRARVIAEGGNLGMTQAARVEYALNGGVVNTDFIDNSAGVDCSDHEVNIKILLNSMVASGEMTKADRNKLLESMTNEVGELVLLDNYEQSQMLSLESMVALQSMDLFTQFMGDLEKEGRLDRKLECLPSDAAMVERKVNNNPLTRPEIAMLLAYSKMYLKQDILNSAVSEDAFFDKYLLTAFPKVLGDKYFEQMRQHSLRREIVSTQLCKAISDRMGVYFVDRLHRETGASVEFIIRAYAVAETIFDLENIWAQINALDYKVDTRVQYRMMLHLYYLIRRATRWFLRNYSPDIDIQATVNVFAPAIIELANALPTLLDGPDKEGYDMVIEQYTSDGVPMALATRIAACSSMYTALDIIEAARQSKLPLEDMAKTYYQMGNQLELNWLRGLMNEYVVQNQWDELARAGFRDDLDRVQRELCIRVLTAKLPVKGLPLSERIDLWIQSYQFLLIRWKKLIADIHASDNVGFVTYSVVLRELFDFAQAAA
jgi:glutamate dehydrogenase